MPTALVAPAVETLRDADYCRHFRHALRPTRPVPNRRNEVGSGTGSGTRDHVRCPSDDW